MKKWQKPNLDIKSIGYFRFWFGVFIGIGYTIIFSILFKLFLEVTFYVATREYYFDWYKSGYSSFFVISLSFSLAFCFTTFHWMSTLDVHSTRIVKRNKRYAGYAALSIFSIIMLLLQRLYVFYAGLIFDWKSTYGILLCLLPIYIYYYCWNLIRNVFKIRKIFLIFSFIGVIKLTVLYYFLF